MGSVVQPLEPGKLKMFMTSEQMTKTKVDAVIKAIKNYNKVCSAAAVTLEKELNKIIPPRGHR
jgi:hypothetical protein